MLNFDKPVKNMTLHNKFVGDFKSVPHYVCTYAITFCITYRISFLQFLWLAAFSERSFMWCSHERTHDQGYL